MNARIFSGLAALLAVGTTLALAACANDSGRRPDPSYATAAATPFIPANYAAADALLAQLDGKLGNTQPLLIATVVNIDALEQSSTFGRLVSEQIAARFSQAGLAMVETKIRNNIYMKRDQGELLLTREIREVAQNHSAQAVIVGTYADSSDFAFVNLKVISPGNNVVIAAHDYALPKDDTVRSLLKAQYRR